MRTFSTDTGTTSADGTRLFFDWLERSCGAKFGGKPLPMDGANDATSKDNTINNVDIDIDMNSTNTKHINTNNGNDDVVVTRDSLELEDLERLFRHEIAALRVRGFYPAKAALGLGKELASEGNTKSAQNWKVSTSRGLESSDVFTVGRHPPHNIAFANSALEEYFGEVRNELRDRRGLPIVSNTTATTKEMIATTSQEHENSVNTNNGNRSHQEEEQQRQRQPRLWPLDLLRLELDELWPGGAGLARAESVSTSIGTSSGGPSDGKSRCMGGGLPRLMVGPTRWKKGLVHVDELAPLNHRKGCFSANVYLQLPYGSSSSANIEEEQPVMEIWPLGIRSKWDWYRVGKILICTVQ